MHTAGFIEPGLNLVRLNKLAQCIIEGMSLFVFMYLFILNVTIDAFYKDGKNIQCWNLGYDARF